MRREVQLLILDNYDSYTYNLAQMLSQHCLHPPIVVPNDRYSSWAALVAALPHFDAIVISPGPGHPACAADFGLCAQAYRCGLPVLGVCLGHQGLALAFGGTVHRAPVVMHGRLSSIVHHGGGLFEGVPSPVLVVRYHSLLVDEASLPSCLCITARTADDGLVMAMQHATRPIYGVQFHPESICTAHGDAMLANFVRLASEVRPYLSHARGELAPHSATLPLSPPTPPPPTPPSRVRRHLLVCEPQLIRSLPAEEVFTNLFSSAPMSFWLDAAGGSRRPRYSYMGCAGGPYSHLVCQRESGVYTLCLAAGDAEHAGSEVVPGTTPATTIDEYIRAALAPWADPVTVRCQVPTIAGIQPILEQAPVASFNTPGGERAGLLTPELLFRGGFVGYLSYEAWRHLGPVAQEPSMRARRREAAAPCAPPVSSRDLGDPAGAEAAFMFADRLLAFDHVEGRLLLLCLCEGPTTSSALSWLARQQRALRRLAAMPPPQPTHAPPTAQAAASTGATMQFVADRGREHYLSDIRAIGDFLAAGESYEVCLTTTFRSPECPPPLDLYRRLRRTNPTPHAAYLRFDPRRLCAQAQAQAHTPSASPTSMPAAPVDVIGPGGVVICCSSPERFMRVDRSRAVECKPIKGTAARGATPAEDAAVATALRTDEKSIAENLMIVDLIRNDLGRVCAAGSVSVPKLTLSRTTAPSQRSARGAGIPTMTLPPAKLDLGAQLEAALAEDDDIRPRADDSNQMFMQEVAILQMQAEGWKAEWSIAMQENERLRMALFDAESALEQLPPKEEGEEANEGADDEMQWRELCTSIARAADEEKATLLEELNMVRAELELKRSTAFSTHDDQQRAEVEANKARANADNWRAQYEREQEELERLAAQLKEMQSRSAEAQKTARGNEQSSTGVLAAWREANKKRNEAEAKLHTKKREAEAKLTTVYNEHRQQLEKLQMQIQYKKSEQSEIMQQMNRWRTQWEEEMSEKNAVAAELLTLRSEFEKSSGTYDKEIEGLKDMLERTRAASAELRDRWEDAVQRKNAILGQLDDADKEMQRAMMSARGESRSFAATAQRLNDAKSAAEKMKAQADQAEADRAAAEKDLIAAKEETAGNAIKLNQDVEKLREKLTDAKMQVEVGESRQQQLDAALRELEQAQGEKDAVASDAAQQAAGLAADAENLQKLLEKTRAESLAKQQSASALRAERDTLSDELAGLKAEVEELTVSHDLEVERLQERLGQLQTVQDKLELSVSEKRKEHEKALLDMDMQEEQKMSQMTEQYDSATFNLKESQSMLRDAKAALKKEQKAKQDAEDIIKETKADLEQVLKESKIKEAELQSKLTEEGTLKERLDASLAADRVQSEEAVATLKTQLTEAKKGLRESEAKATEFAKEYGKEFYLRKQIAEQLQEMTGGMRVFCRVRPLPPIVDLTPEQISAGEVQPPPAEPCCKMLDETTILHEDKTNARHPRKRFEFNQVYGPAAEQSKLFDDVRPMIGQTLHGFNVSCIVYGARGSGKTYTLEGTPDEPGLVLRSVNNLFEEISDGAPECMTFEAFLSVVDILDEKFRDLLLPEGSAKQELVSVTRDATYGVRVEGATIAPVRTASHVRSLLAQAQAARREGGREHDSSMVTMLTVRSANTESGESSVGKLTLVDLAAAQPKLKKDEEAPADQNVSLAALTEVIDTLSAGKKKKVDFEASKLTELLQDSLSGNSKSMMLLCVDADPEHATITSQCLTFAEKAKGVKLGAASKNKESMHTAMNKVNTTMSALTQHAGGGQNTARKQ